MNREVNKDAQEKDHDLDRWLDHALVRYGDVEPRPGLESRISARLAIKQREVQRDEQREVVRGLRGWAVIAFGAALMLALATFWVSRAAPGRSIESPVAHLATPAQPGETPAPTGRASDENADSRQGKRLLNPVHTNLSKRRPASASESRPTPRPAPKLDHFPSPQPLNEQEQILTSYVADYPEHAALVAQARAEALLRDRKEEEEEAARGAME